MSDDQRTIAILSARLDVITAERDAALSALDGLERLIDRKQHMWPEEQAALRAAKAVLIEHGRRKAERMQVWEDRK